MHNLQLIENVLYYVDVHLAEEITYDVIASEFGYSPFYFHKLFNTRENIRESIIYANFVFTRVFG